MKKGTKISIRLNPYVFLYSEAKFFLEHSSVSRDSKNVTDLIKRSKFARTSIILFQATVESILRWLLFNGAIKGISMSLKKKIDRMDFKTRLVEITNANCKKIKVSNFQKYNHLLEMADLRNSIIHQEHLQMQGTVETFDKVNNKIKIHLISRSEFYTHSKLQKNVRLVDYFDAIKSNEIVDEFVDWLKINLKRPEDFINTFSIVAHNIKSRSRKLKIGSSLQIEIKGRGEDLIDMASYWPNTKMTFRL